MAQQAPKPTITGKMLAAVKKNPQTQYGSVLPVARDMPPLKEAGKLRVAAPDILRGPTESLLRLLEAVRNPTEATEQTIPDILNVFFAARSGVAARKIKGPDHVSDFGDVISDPLSALGFARVLNLLTADPGALNLREFNDTIMQNMNAPKEKGITIPIEPRTPSNTTYKLEPRKDAK